MGKNKKKKKHILAKFFLGLCIVLVIISGILIGVCKAKYDGQAKKMLQDVSSTILGKPEPIYVLLVGVSEDISAQLSDTIILCGYNPEQQNAFMLSIPRDTFVGKSKASAGGEDKINAYYKKGIDNLKEKVEDLTGVDINNYAVVKTSMLTKIVDAIGGVDFDVPINMNYDDRSQNLHIHLKKGMQKIDGDKAEQLLRFRHNNNGTSYPSSYGDNDIGRMRTQREFIKETVRQTLDIKNTLKIKTIAKTVLENLDTNLDMDQILPYLSYAIDFDVEQIRMEQLPGESSVYNGLWFFNNNKTKTLELMDELKQSMETK